MTPATIRDSIDALIGDISQLRGEVAWLRRANDALRAETAAHRAESATLRAENEALRAKNEALRGGERRPSASTGSGQFDEFQAAVERRAEEEAAHPRQPSRALGQEKRRAGGTQGRHAAAGRSTRSGRAARSADVPALSGGADGFDAARRGDAAGVRSARSADRGHGASGLDLLLRGVRRRDESRVPRRRDRAGAVRGARPSGGGLSQRPATHSRGSGRPNDGRSVRRSASLPAKRGGVGARQGAALEPVAAHIAALAAAAPVRCLDETGFRVAGNGNGCTPSPPRP